MEINPVDVDTYQSPATEKVDIDVGQAQPMSSAVAASRAYKTYYGLGDVLGTDYGTLYSAFSQGKEDTVRESAANIIDAHAKQASLDHITRLAANGPVDPDTVNQLLARHTPTDPKSVIEKGYAHQYMSNLEKADKSLGGTDFGQAVVENPETTKDAIGLGTELVSKSQMTQKWLQDAQEAAKGQSWLGYLSDMGKTLIPGYSSAQLRNMTGAGFFTGIGLGENMHENAVNLLMKPFGDFQEQGQSIMDQLIKSNPQLAVQWAQALVGQSYGSIAANSVLEGIDLAMTPGLGALGAGALRKVGLYNTARGAVKGMVRGQASEEPVRVAAPLAAGDVGEAAVQKGTIRTMEDLQGADTYDKRAIDTLTSNFRVDKTAINASLDQHPEDLSREAQTRLNDRYDAAGPNAINLIRETAKMEQSPLSKAAEDFNRQLRQEYEDMYPEYRGSIYDVSGPEDAPLGIGKVFNLYLGRADGKGLYAKKYQAMVGAVAKGIPGAVIEQRGAGWVIVKPVPIRLNSEPIRDLYMKIPDAVTPNSWLKATLGWIASPNETTSVDERINRVVATYAPNAFLQYARRQITEITNIAGLRNRDKMTRFQRLLEAGQQMPDPMNNNVPGVFFKTPHDIQDFYQRNFRMRASDEEIEAYFAFKRVVELDRMLREVAINRNAHRVGGELHTVYTFDENGKKLNYPQIIGVKQASFPQGNADHILIMRPRHGDHIIQPINRLDPNLRSQLTKRMETGQGKAFEIYDPETRPYQAVTGSDKWIRYVYTEGLETEPLNFSQLPRRGGGHFQREYDHYLVQPKMRYDEDNDRWSYEGDAKYAAIEHHGVGENLAKHVNQMMDIAKTQGLEAARAFGEKHIAVEWLDKFFSMYGKKDGIHPDVPFRVVPYNRLSVDMDNSLRDRFGDSLVDRTRAGSLARTAPVEFTKERDAYDILAAEDQGTKDRPFFGFQSASVMDALPMMNRGLARIIQSQFMDLFKFSAIEAWARRARNVLKDPELAKYSPYRVFMQNAATLFKTGADPKIVSQLAQDKMKIDQFIGIPSKLDTFLNSMAQSLSDSIYGKFGPKAIQIAPTWLIPKLRDPSRFIRSVVYNEKVGLFSIPQFLVHATTYSTVLGVAGPRRAFAGTYAAMLHGWATLNPEMLDTLDRYASKLNSFGSKFKPGEFRESVELSRSTGFLQAEHENAYLDSVFNNQIIKSKGQQFLDAGAIFFRSGLQSVRAAAWHTAYREFRDQFPDKLITNVERNAILDRADLLAHNMSMASSSLLNRGFTALPFQFYTYQLRLAELFLGKRTSIAEKASLFATNALLFGLPVAASLTGLPLEQSIRQAANDHGYIVGDGFFKSMGMEGGIATFLKFLTGNDYNVGARFGTKGFEPLAELRTSPTIWSIYGGAAGGTLSNSIQALDGFWRASLSSLKTVAGIPQPEGEVFPMTTEDVVNGITLGQAREISSVNAAVRFKQAIHTAHWLSKNGTYLSDASPWDALFMTVTGLEHQQQADAWNKITTMKEEKNDQAATEKKFLEQMGYAFQAMVDNDPEQSAAYTKRAQAILIQDGYPIEKLHQVYSAAARAHQPLVQRINWDYYMKDVPGFRKQVGYETYERLMEIENEQKQGGSSGGVGASQ